MTRAVSGSRRRRMAAAAGLFVAIFALRFAVSSDTDAILVLFVVPIAICAIEFGLVGGVAAAATACLMVAFLGLLGVVSIGAIGYLSRFTPFLLVGLLLGRFVDTQRALVTRASNAEDLTRDLLATVGRDGRFRRVNPAWESTLGYSTRDLLSQPFIDFVHPEDVESTRRAAAELAAGAELVGFCNRLRAKDGSYRSLEWNARADLDGGMIYCTARDVTSRQQAEKESADARAEAERANLAKSEFLSRMSHELRTPLNSVLGFGQLLQMDELTPAQQESVAQILRGGRHLLSLIDEILDISRIEAGRMTVSLEPVDVLGTIADAIALIRPIAAESGIAIEADPPAASEVHVQADAQRLRQVLLNLLSNAVKYNRENGTIRVAAQIVDVQGEESQQRVRISVADTGRGIAAADVERLFTPFERFGAEQTSVQGTGLGLALSKGLVDLMHGDLSVHSVPGEGTTFVVDLRRTDGLLVPASSDTSHRASRPGESVPDACALLHIEDNLANIQLVEQIFADQPKVRVIPATQARLGLQLAEQHEPDVILLDMHLPDLPGAAALEMLKANRRTEGIPVVVLSADATNGQIKRLLQAGASDYLTKPLEVDRLLDVLQDLLRAP